MTSLGTPKNATDTVAIVTAQRGRKRVNVLGRLLRRPGAAAAAAFLVIVILASVLAPVIAGDPNAFTASERLLPPSLSHLFGTDKTGRDVFFRTVYGGQASLTVGFATALIATVLGALIGILSSMMRVVDVVVMRIVDGVMSFPILVLALSMTAILGPGQFTVIFALTIVFFPSVTRIVRSTAIVASELPMIDAARAIGASGPRIFFRYVLPQCTTPILVQAAIVFTTAVLVESALSFIGAGLPPTVPSWGGALAEARSYLTTAPWMWGFPGLALVLTVLSANVVIDAVRDILDPRDGAK